MDCARLVEFMPQIFQRINYLLKMREIDYATKNLNVQLLMKLFVYLNY